MGKVHGSDIFTARAGIRNQISCIRDWLLLTGMPRETAYTVTLQMQELADAALRKAAERQVAQTSAQTQARETEPAP